MPERLLGLLELKDSKIPFEFDKESFELRLYQPVEDGRYGQMYKGILIMASNLKEHKWADRIIIKGKTSEGYLMYFGTTDDYSSYNDYRTYNIDWYYITDINENLIDEIRFYGREIDYFFSPEHAFQKKIKYKNEKYVTVESMSVQTVECEALNCGAYMSGKIRVDVSCNSYATMYPQSSAPLNSKSFLRLKFSEKIGLNEVIKKVRNVQKFLEYTNYRTNIEFSNISTYVLENNKVRNCGQIVFNAECKDECSKRAKERIIKAEYLKEHVSDILKAIDGDEISFGYLCSSVENMSHYSISRIIMILASFEREFRNIYGQDVRRSEEYKETKNQVIGLIEEHAETLTGKRKKYVKDFAKGIKNHDSSYGDNLKYALEDCKEIIEPFVIRRFDGTYEEIIEDVSLNINGLRNGIAHSRLDLELEARHLTDIKFVEELLYVIRLKSIGVDRLTIQKSINELFRENMALE